MLRPEIRISAISCFTPMKTLAEERRTLLTTLVLQAGGPSLESSPLSLHSSKVTRLELGHHPPSCMPPTRTIDC